MLHNASSYQDIHRVQGGQYILDASPDRQLLGNVWVGLKGYTC